jgi:molybdopterin-binding protein
MPISARNQLIGKVSEVRLGDIMAHVIVKIGKNVIESVITRKSAEELSLKKGDRRLVIRLCCATDWQPGRGRGGGSQGD